MEDDYAIGLDFGSKFLRMGVYRNGGVEIIPNSNGDKLTPSVVIFKDNEIIVGEDTLRFPIEENYDDCIYDLKKLIGLNLNYKYFKDIIDHFPFKIDIIKNDCVELKINTKNGIRTFELIDILCLIILKMVQNAQNYLCKQIKKLVITVPAYFVEIQRKIIQQAAEMSGLEVIEIINEPTAAALAYGLTNKKIDNKKIMVFDLGGSECSVTILSYEHNESINLEEDEQVQILSSAVDLHLGGEDFDNALVDYILKKSYINEDIRKDKKAMRLLKDRCENAKKILSNEDSTFIRISNIYKDIDIHQKITSVEFEGINYDLFNRLEDLIKKALYKGKIIKEEISDIILVGGSTKIPKLKNIIKHFFYNKITIHDSLNPVEINTYGATLFAEKLLYNNQLENIQNFYILDIIPFSLGIGISSQNKDNIEGDEMEIIIKRGTPIPSFNEKVFYTTYDNQTSFHIEIYEGEKKYVKYNHLIKKIILDGLTPKPKGKTKLSVEFNIDINGILYVKAVEESEKNGKIIYITIKNDGMNISDESINNLKEKYKDINKKLKKEIIDSTNIKELLRILKDSRDSFPKKKKEEDDDDDEGEEYKLIYFEYNEFLELFIDSFELDLNNETILQKYYLYIRELFFSYIATLKLDLDEGERKSIFEKMKRYLKIFIKNGIGYLNDLLDVINNISKRELKRFKYELIIDIMGIMNKYGKENIINRKQICKYNSLIYFEQSYSYYNKYLSFVNEALFSKKSLDNLKQQKQMSLDYINDINSGAIILSENFHIPDEINYDFDKEFFNIYKKLGFLNKRNLNREELLSILREYEKLLASIQISREPSVKEALCITKILKINYDLDNFKSRKKYLFYLAERRDIIIERLKLNYPWCKEFP